MRTVIEMAREAGWDDHHAEFDTRLKRFAEIVSAAEREACASLCENLVMPRDKVDCWDIGTLDCAKAIRERSNT